MRQTHNIKTWLMPWTFSRAGATHSIHDTRLVALMNAERLTHLLTLNPSDFRRFAELITTTPRDILLSSTGPP